jgi:predicted amidophosphoribosyltransferase
MAKRMIRETVWTTWVDRNVKSWFGICQNCECHITSPERYCPGCGLEFDTDRDWHDFTEGDVLMCNETTESKR